VGLTSERFQAVLRGEQTVRGEPPEAFESTGALALKAEVEKRAAGTPVTALGFFFDEWPVMPVGLRPLVPLDAQRFATSDLNDLYRRVINRNNRLKRLIELNAPVIILINEARMLQESVESLLDNTREGRVITGPDRRPLVSLIDHLSGDLGFLWTLDRRVDFSATARAVPIADDAVLQVPRAMARVLLEPWAWAWLERHGHAKSIKEARLLTREQSALGEQALDAVMASVTLLLINPRNDQVAGAVVCRPWAHPALGVGGSMARQLALEPGDELVVHVPCGPDAVAEVKALEHGRPVRTTDTGWIARARDACLESNQALARVLMTAAIAGEQDPMLHRRTVVQLGRLPVVE